jgi:hypothetical protein
LFGNKKALKLIEFNFHQLTTNPLYLMSSANANQGPEIIKKVLDDFFGAPLMDEVEESSISYKEEEGPDAAWDLDHIKSSRRKILEFETEKEIDVEECLKSKNKRVSKESKEKMLKVLMNNLKAFDGMNKSQNTM